MTVFADLTRPDYPMAAQRTAETERLAMPTTPQKDSPYNILALPPETILILLAQGLERQYDTLRNNRSVVRQKQTELDASLIAALPRLSALYMCEGKEDKAASVHKLMEMATTPLKEWGIDYFAKEDFPYQDVILIDPQTLAPTPESFELAAKSGGYGEDQILEDHYHTQVRDLVQSARTRRDQLYTSIREFIVRHPLATIREIEDWKDSLRFPKAKPTLASFYRDIPVGWTHDGTVHQCSNCGGLLKPHPDKRLYPDGICVVSNCRKKGIFHKTDELSDSQDMKLLKNQLLTYWVGPGLDEIKIYDAAKAAGRNAALYPSSDACDISLDGFAVGIDAKSYTSAMLLIKRLNNSIGRLIEYDRKIIAVSDELDDRFGNYMATLRSEKKDAANDLEFITVGALIRSIHSGEI
ncbi:hypothetical protein [Desulfonema magnum]|uniref:PPIWI RE REase domain-containing protein n=1 Tax=Desulfonema magnum TaxID=45655 RepID=A0A975GL50_9BACT|nr:hypothetical protein [Desulfonema magnum]QTA84433.1 pPIWI RE REase domain-containing protein [Desulfonema magnum]